MNWLSRIFKGSADSDSQKAFAKSKDKSVSELSDLYPSNAAIAEAIVNTGRFNSSDIQWMTSIAASKIQSGMNFRGALQEIIRSGEPLSAHTLRAKGLNPRRKVGEKFINAIVDDGVDTAIEALDVALHTEIAKALHLHDLHRMQNLGVEFCKFLGPGEGANLPLEKELDGRQFAIGEAIQLVRSNASQIRRSRFAPEVKF